MTDNIAKMSLMVEAKMNCPPLNELLDYTRRLLTPNDSERIAAHLSTDCLACAENIAWLQMVATSSAANPSYLFPAETLLGMKAWFRSQPPHQSHSPLTLVARLLFDSFTQPEWALARSNANEDAVSERQMLFQTDGYDIDLRFEVTDNRSFEDLIGQLSPQGDMSLAGAMVELRQFEQFQRSTEIDADGYFKFAQIPLGAYDLKIQLPEGEITLAQVTTMRSA